MFCRPYSLKVVERARFPLIHPIQHTALFLLHFHTVPIPLFLRLFSKQLLSAKTQTLHPFSNVENVVQMFLIVIIKTKSGYVKCGLLLWLMIELEEGAGCC